MFKSEQKVTRIAFVALIFITTALFFNIRSFSSFLGLITIISLCLLMVGFFNLFKHENDKAYESLAKKFIKSKLENSENIMLANSGEYRNLFQKKKKRW